MSQQEPVVDQRDDSGPDAETSVVGSSRRRLDAVSKIIGEAEYTYDIDQPRMLHVETVKSPHSHARILDIDVSAAESMTGVQAVVTGEDVPDHRFGAGIHDERILPREKVRFVGEPVVAIAAETETLARDAADAVEVEYEKLPAVFDTREALSTDPPSVVHEGLGDYEQSGVLEPRLDPDRPNLHANHRIRTGDTDAGFDAADGVYEGSFSTGMMHHVQMEPHVSVARWSADGELRVWTSTNTTYRVKNMLATAFGVSSSKVNLTVPYVGGSFGGKEGVTEPIAAAVAQHTDGRPVKLAFSRQDQFIEGTYRTPFEIDLKLGLTEEGDITAMEVEAYLGGGAYAGTGFLVTRNCGFAAVGTYDVPNLTFDSYGVYTNLPIAGSFRGFGNSQLIFAIESLLEDAALDLGLDPVDVRERNTMETGDENPAGETMKAMGAKECLRRAARAVDMENRDRDSDDDEWIRGVGLAQGSKYSMAPTASSAFVKVHDDGRIEVRTTAEEIGTGSMTVLAQIAAEEFGVDLDDVRVLKGDTEVTPYDDGSISSRLTFNTGNAVRKACIDAKEQLFQHAAVKLDADAEDLATAGGEVYVKGERDRSVTMEDLYEPTVFGGGGFLKEGGEILGKATWVSPVENVDPETGRGDRLTAFYTHGAQACDLEINRYTGEVRFNSFVSVYDVGRAINPKMVEGQLEGGISMGIGSTLYEELTHDNGRIENANLLDYKVPFSTEHPLEVHTEIVETYDEEGPYGAKGVGEAVLIPSAAAIGNAIKDATGSRLTGIPFTPEEILDAVESDDRD
ncbi:xanthine dehydrogenase family protein molybdopterin-binding subunit [Salinigranum salinum]|uniref:xanthine dehydrogenase family protein molybdopterin-binding subunit n=1 Tax=Salinigranum salinum TaxID=1364937 RepID=UPI001260B789|nr:xanthine dehydrogenase family protein molybdopterin-binding subunit [Salinigranum salinum]